VLYYQGYVQNSIREAEESPAHCECILLTNWQEKPERLSFMPMIKFGIATVATFAVTVAFAAERNDLIRLADNVVPAPFGYEAVTTKYLVAEPTRLYISPYIYPGTVNNETLQPGQAVDILAKAKGYDWALAGKDGIGIGYIPISRLIPVSKGAP
jgi:hypothetical protein